MGTDLSNPNVILWINTQWAYQSDDGGITFNNVFTDEVSPGFWQSRGIDNIDMLDMVISEADNNVIYAGSFDLGFWRSLDHGRSWQGGNNGNFTGSWGEGGGNVIGIVSDPDRGNVVWATQSLHQKGKSPTYLIRSDDQGETSSWVASNAGLPLVEVMGLSLDRNSPITNRTLFVTAQGDLYKSTDDGASWNRILANNGLRYTAVDPFDGNIVYAGGGAGLWRSTNGGTTWSEAGTTEMRGTVAFWGWGNGTGVWDITPDPNVQNRVYVTAFGNGKGLYRSNDKGVTWTKLYTDDFMRKVDVSPLDENIVIATSSNALTHGGYNPDSKGVLYSEDAFATAPIQMNQGMAWPFANTVAMDELGSVFIGSNGTGFQEGIVPGTAGDDIIISYSAAATINSIDSFDVAVNYETTTDRDIHIVLQSTSDWKTYGGGVKTVTGNGIGNTVIRCTPERSPAAGSDYRLILFMTPKGSTWQHAIGHNQYEQIAIDNGTPQFTLAAIALSGGSISLSPAGGSYDEGTAVTITAIPSSGNQFDNWSGDISGATNPLTISVNSNKNVTANFSVIPTGNDIIRSYSAPASINSAGSFDVAVNYETTTDRDIHIALQSTIDWVTYGGGVKTVTGNGAGSAIVRCTPKNNPAEGSDYRLILFMTPKGSTWQHTIGSNQYEPIIIDNGSP